MVLKMANNAFKNMVSCSQNMWIMGSKPFNLLFKKINFKYFIDRLLYFTTLAILSIMINLQIYSIKINLIFNLI